MSIIDHPSPNYSPRRAGVRVDTVVLHHTAAAGPEGSLAWLCDPQSQVSAHYLVGGDGRVWRLVPEERKAWHAGLGRLPWETVKPYDFNHRSIGIELVNPGDGKTPFTEDQYRALGELLPDIVRRLDGVPSVAAGTAQRPSALVQRSSGFVWILGHRDVAPGRKTDPADNFDWGRVREMLAGRTT